MNKIELSVKQILKSALVNLAEKYLDNLEYANALFEISDYYQVKDIAISKASILFSNNKDQEKLIEAIKDSDDANDIVRTIRKYVSDKNEAKKFFTAINQEIISTIEKHDLVFQNGVSCAEIENIGEFFSLDEASKRAIMLFHAWDEVSEFEDLCNSECRNFS